MTEAKQNFFAVNRTYDLYELIRGEVETVKAYVVDKETVGKKTSIFPTVTFTQPTEENAKLGLFQYVITEKDEEGNDQDVATSVTFTEALSDEAINALDLEYKQDENGDHYFDMDREFFTTRIANLNLAAAYEKLGVPYIKEAAVENSAVFTIPAQSETSGETMVFYTTVELTEEDFALINKSERVKCGSLVLNIQAIVLSFNIDNAVVSLCENLSSEHAVEPVSVTVTKQVVSEASYKLANQYMVTLKGNTAEQQVTSQEETEGLVGDETDQVQTADVVH